MPKPAVTFLSMVMTRIQGATPEESCDQSMKVESIAVVVVSVTDTAKQPMFGLGGNDFSVSQAGLKGRIDIINKSDIVLLVGKK